MECVLEDVLTLPQNLQRLGQRQIMPRSTGIAWQARAQGQSNKDRRLMATGCSVWSASGQQPRMLQGVSHGDPSLPQVKPKHATHMQNKAEEEALSTLSWQKSSDVPCGALRKIRMIRSRAVTFCYISVALAPPTRRRNTATKVSRHLHQRHIFKQSNDESLHGHVTNFSRHPIIRALHIH